MSNTLDNFFNDLNLIVQPEILSTCCGARVLGETFLNVGRCSDCLEMSLFEEQE